MSSNIYEDPNWTVNVKYREGAGEDGGERVERLVDIYESGDTQDRGAHTHKHPPAVHRNPFRAAALVLSLLCLLLVVGVTVLSKLYISVNLDLDKVQSSYKELQSSFDILSNGFCKSQDTENQTQGSIPEWTRFQCSCYYKSTEMKSWTESRSDCQSRGADLVIINSKDEHDFVSNLSKPQASWIGLQSVNIGDWSEKWKWKWVDGSTPTYLAWQVDVSVNAEDGRSAKAYIDLKGKWNHTKTGFKRWICKRQIY